MKRPLCQTIRIPSSPRRRHTAAQRRQPYPINIEEEMRRSYLDYSMSVIIGRALPDARDGLKPCIACALHAERDGLQYNKKYTKCAKVVASDGRLPSARRLGHLRHSCPHASLSACATAGGRTGQLGSVDAIRRGDALHECRMERIAGEMLADIEMETVDFVPNYDESTFEPTVLPTRFPDLIVNGSAHRGRHGHQHSAAQPHRSPQRGYRTGAEP